MKTCADSTEELSTYPLKYADVTGIHSDGQFVYDIKAHCCRDAPAWGAVSQVAEVTLRYTTFEIKECVEEVVAAGVADCELLPGFP
ncbi:hypothetical protein [Methanoculleus sp.]|uniref:hypothetical protein n=1 Tax=Methanoculleus sp. TaxID=90427 RepID=UPI0026011BD3|nr:hypothetical protein [Methanoculleus sp.]